MRLKNIGFVILFSVIAACSAPSYTSYESVNQPLDSTYDSNELEPLIKPYRDIVDQKMNAIIGHADSALISYKPESPLGNFTADRVFAYAAALNVPAFSNRSESNSMALLNFGGLRAPINQGDITIATIYELMPFDNTLEIVVLDSTGIDGLMRYLYESEGQPVSNAKFELSATERSGRINGELIDFSKPLYVYTSDYLAGGGDKMNFLKNAGKRWNSGVLLRDIFIEYISAVKNITKPQVENRIKIEQ